MSGPADRAQRAASQARHPRHQRAVVEAHDQLGAHAQPGRAGPTTRRTSPRPSPRGGMKSISVAAPSRGLELGLEDQRVDRDSGACVRACGSAGAISQRPFVRRAEQRREAGAAVEARPAQPVDRAVAGRPARAVSQSPISA